MNGKERFYAILNGDKVDHVPVWLLFPYHPLKYCYVDVRNSPKFKPVVAAVEKYGITLNRRSMSLNTFSPDVKVENKIFDEAGEHVNQTTYTYKGRSLFSEIRFGKNETKITHLLNSQEDIEFYCSLPVNASPDALKNELYCERLKY